MSIVDRKKQDTGEAKKRAEQRKCDVRLNKDKNKRKMKATQLGDEKKWRMNALIAKANGKGLHIQQTKS